MLRPTLLKLVKSLIFYGITERLKNIGPILKIAINNFSLHIN